MGVEDLCQKESNMYLYENIAWVEPLCKLDYR